MYCCQKLGEDFAKFCGLLRIDELYVENKTTHIHWHKLDACVKKPNYKTFMTKAMSRFFFICFVIDNLKVTKIQRTFSFSFLKVKKSRKLFFQVDVSFKERTNKFYFTTMKPQVDLFLFFLGEN